MNPIETATLVGEASSVEFDTSVVMEGGKKRVYFTRDKRSVVAFFKDPEWAQANRNRLTQVVAHYNPTRVGEQYADYWRRLFCWPTHLVTHAECGLGLLLPTYPEHFFFKSGRLANQEKDGGRYNCTNPSTKRLQRYDLIAPEERGTLAGYLGALSRVARAVHKMHAAGLAHSDLSERNVLVDPVTGHAIIIDVDALVVTGQYPPEVLGTRGFTAPEVMATRHLPFDDPKRKHACAETDKYALAVLIYRFLLERHPLDGPRFLKGLSGDAEEEALMGSKALYSEHRNDGANRPKAQFLSARILGKTIDDLFHRTFVDGLLDPRSRPTASSWADALVEAYDQVLVCSDPACTHKGFVLTAAGAPRCPYCSTAFRGTFSRMTLSQEGRMHPAPAGLLVLNGFRNGDGTQLYRHHTHAGAPRGPGQDNTVVAQVVYLERPHPDFYLQNVALPGAQVRHPSTGAPDFVPFPLLSKVRLVSGLEVRFGLEPEARTGRIETFRYG